MNENIKIIAGPCSVDMQNKDEIHKIAELAGIAGVRVVGLKSRTNHDPTGEGMGIDFHATKRNQQHFRNREEFEIPPSVLIAKEIFESNGIMIATEIIDPHLQIPTFEGILPEGKFLGWNPSVNQLGSFIDSIRTHTQPNGWNIGLKNGKWVGGDWSTQSTEIEKVWKGLASFATANGNGGNVIMIHRGFEDPDKGDHRNLPIHLIAKRVKSQAGLPMFFDPSHTFGPKLRDQIVERTLECMKMRMLDGTFLYDGILIEAGTSKTDTNQHITLNELEDMVDQLGQFRNPVES